MGEQNDVTMTYTGMLNGKNGKIVRVRFERGKNAYAECLLPDGIIEKAEGFAPEEQEQLLVYLKANQKEIFEKAKEIDKNILWNL